MKHLALLLASVVILSGCVSSPETPKNTSQDGATTVAEIVDNSEWVDLLVGAEGTEWVIDTLGGNEILILARQENYAEIRWELGNLQKEKIEGKWSTASNNLIVSGVYRNTENPSDQNNGKTLNAVFSCIDVDTLKNNAKEHDASPIEFTAFYNLTESTPEPTCSGESRTYRLHTY